MRNETTESTYDFDRIVAAVLGDEGESASFHFPSTTDVLLEYFSAYVSNLEKHLEAERSRARERLEFHPEARAYLEEHLFVIESIFPNLLRSSLVVSVYTVLENGLRNRCDCLQNWKGCPFSADEIAERGNVPKYKKYVERLTDIRFQQIGEWRQLEAHGEIRNRIVHNQGQINPSNTSLVEFIHRAPYLHIVDGRITFEQGACQAFIDTVRRFLEALDKRLPTECSDLETHFGFRP